MEVMCTRALLAAVLVAAAAPAQRAPVRSRSAQPQVTFSRHIAPILQQRCQACHRPGDVAPFPLLTYRDAASNARRILTAVQTRQMPPWKPVPGHGEFLDENRLSDREIAILTRWIESGAPEGDPREMPQPLLFPDQWTLGTPDLIIEPDSDFTIGAEGQDVYRCFSVPTRLLESRWVAGIEVRPGNRRVAHHVLVYPDPLGLSALKRADGEGPGYSCFGGPGILTDNGLGGWAPGIRPRLFPQGVGIRLTPFSRVVIQVHYHATGARETDRTRVGLHFARGPVTSELYQIPLINTRFEIPAGAERHEVTASLVMPAIPGVKAISITPHMHLLGRQIRVDAVYPDGARRPMIYIDDWDFQWQAIYYYRDPVPLPPGTRLELRAVYDNSENNPRNPFRPPRPVRWGEQTTDEMCLTFLGVIRE